MIRVENCGIGDSNVGVIVDRDWLTLEVLEICNSFIIQPKTKYNSMPSPHLSRMHGHN